MGRRYFTRPYRIRRKRQVLKSRFFWFGILFLAVIGGIFYFFIFSDFFQVKKIIVTGENRISTEDIKSVVENGLERETLSFKIKSIFLVNTNKIRENLLERFPQIEEVEISRGYPDALNLLVIERKEVGIFCRDILCFLLDRQGVIFYPVRNNISNGVEPALTESSLLKFQNQTIVNEELKLGEKAIDKELLTTILRIESKLREDLKIPVKDISIMSEERFNVETVEGWQVFFNSKENLSWQETELVAVLENRVLPEKRKNLKYIDLRFEKVYIFPEGILND